MLVHLRLSPCVMGWSVVCDQMIVAINWHVTNKPQHEISNNVVCATSKATDQPAHMRSLIRAFASRLNVPIVFSY